MLGMMLKAKKIGLIVSVGILILWNVPVVAEEAVDDLPNLTGGVVPVIFYKEHDPFTNDRLTSVSHIEYVIRVKNKTNDPIAADSLILIVDKIIEITGDDISARVAVEGADGLMADGRPYFNIPVNDNKDLAPFSESEPVIVELENPDYLRFYPPSLEVRGLPRESEKSVQGLLDTLVNKGLLTTDEAAHARESSSVPQE